jgi:hypothetical protein
MSENRQDMLLVCNIFIETSIEFIEMLEGFNDDGLNYYVSRYNQENLERIINRVPLIIEKGCMAHEHNYNSTNCQSCDKIIRLSKQWERLKSAALHIKSVS